LELVANEKGSKKGWLSGVESFAWSQVNVEIGRWTTSVESHPASEYEPKSS
jgi:hypothetical protein